MRHLDMPTDIQLRGWVLIGCTVLYGTGAIGILRILHRAAEIEGQPSSYVLVWPAEVTFYVVAVVLVAVPVFLGAYALLRRRRIKRHAHERHVALRDDA